MKEGSNEHLLFIHKGDGADLQSEKVIVHIAKQLYCNSTSTDDDLPLFLGNETEKALKEIGIDCIVKNNK